MDKGYISLNRSVEDNWLWKQRPFSKGQAWIDLILLANYSDVKIPKGDEVIAYKRGCVHRSIYFLADRWGWNRKTVRRFLSVLESDQMVSVSCTASGTTITLINYEKYQNHWSTDGTTYGTTDGTTHGTQTIITNNNQKRPNARARASDRDQVFQDFLKLVEESERNDSEGVRRDTEDTEQSVQTM